MTTGTIGRIVDFVLSPHIFAPLIYPGLLAATLVLLTLIWAERKMTAKVQLRYGPLYVLKPLGGAIQLIADAIKFMFQEPIMPRNADKWVFALAPVAMMAFTIIPFAFIPAAPGFVGVDVEYSLPLVLSLSALIPPLILATSWAANNKFTLLGGVREAFMMVAYEVSLFIAAFAVASYYGTLSLSKIVEAQSVPGIILNPIAAGVFFVTMLMTASKLPYDIVEGEQEIVAGPFTEYSGILYMLVMGASYMELYVLSLVFVELFLGGWKPVIPALASIHPAFEGISLFIKAYLVLLFAVFLRSVYARYRLDQALEIGWKKLFPLALLSVIWSLALLLVAGGA